MDERIAVARGTPSLRPIPIAPARAASAGSACAQQTAPTVGAILTALRLVSADGVSGIRLRTLALENLARGPRASADASFPSHVARKRQAIAFLSGGILPDQ